ncbi:MAG: ABC transporter ATP-binding protein [Hyphomicrobiaceae bacterium]
MTSALEIRIDKKRYSGGRKPILVLEGIEISVETGSFVAITGPSGCGKTTLLNIVAGLDRDFVGHIAFGVREPRLAYVFQTPRLLPWRTVLENVTLAMPPHEIDVARIRELLVRVGLGEAIDVYPERLSLGMQRRVALARAFALAPNILLMDEPFVSLDERTAQNLRALLIDLCRLRPTTVLFVTHNTAEAAALSTRILRLCALPARIVQDMDNRRSAGQQSVA